LFDARSIAWLSVVVLPVIGILFKKIRSNKKWIFFSETVLAVAIIICIIKQHRPDFEQIIKMSFHAQNHQWEDVLKTNEKTAVSALSCFYTNLALQKTGQMAEKMFQYEQIGISGLIVDLKDQFSCAAKSELFYQLGWINPARHYACESMSGYSYIKEPNIQNMKRLLECAVVRHDSDLASKYEKIMNKTLFYRDYVQKQEYPSEINMNNMLIRNMPAVLESIMEANSHNQAIFEYLMAYYLLEREYEKAKNCFDRYFSNFPYSQIPTHYAEFLALYKRLKLLDDSFYAQYPVSKEIRERFDMMDTLISSNMTKKIMKTVESGFKNTYWFYVRFPLVNIQTVQQDEKKIY